MPITGFDHLNIRTMNVEGTLRFFRDLLGMRISPLPGRSDLAMGGWVLDPTGQALIHVNHGDYGYPTDADFAPVTGAGSGPVHHLALKCAGFDQLRQRLVDAQVKFTQNLLPEYKLRQLFLQEPNGIFVELNFWDNA